MNPASGHLRLKKYALQSAFVELNEQPSWDGMIGCIHFESGTSFNESRAAVERSRGPYFPNERMRERERERIIAINNSGHAPPSLLSSLLFHEKRIAFSLLPTIEQMNIPEILG